MKTDPLVVLRWRELREILIRQLEMFESGRLTLRTGGVDVAPDAVQALKRNILDFDALISEDEARPSAAAL